MNGHEPQGSHTEIGRGAGVAIVQIIQFGCDAVEVADTITVRVVKAADKDFVEDSVVPPGEIVGALGKAGDDSHRR